MYDRVCKLSEEAERLGDSELLQVLANILQTARYVPLLCRVVRAGVLRI